MVPGTPVLDGFRLRRNRGITKAQDQGAQDQGAQDQGAIAPMRQNRRSNGLPQSRSVLDFELTFLGDALERLAGILDAILIVVAIGRQ